MVKKYNNRDILTHWYGYAFILGTVLKVHLKKEKCECETNQKAKEKNKKNHVL